MPSDRITPSHAEIAPYTPMESLIDSFQRLGKRMLGEPAVPTLMHITHAKAGSTWINHLLQRLFPSQCAPRGVAAVTGGNLDAHVFQRGRVYGAMFLRRDQFLQHPELQYVRRFVVIRDLRDTLVSLYFSVKDTHALENANVAATRPLLQKMAPEEGLLHLIETTMRGVANMQQSWLGQGEIVLRYEDIVGDPFQTLHDALIEQLELPISKEALDRAIRRTHFQTVFKRRLGEENARSHGRKGLPGDWRNHFTPDVCREFAARFADTLVAAGHEMDDAWARA